MASQGGSSAHKPLEMSSVVEAPPPLEEDLAQASAWDDEDTSTLVSSKWKGKGKQRDDDDDDDCTVDGNGIHPEADEYPPIAEEELELRKVEQVSPLSMPFMYVTHTQRPAEPQTMGNTRETAPQKVTRVPRQHPARAPLIWILAIFRQ